METKHTPRDHELVPEQNYGGKQNQFECRVCGLLLIPYDSSLTAALNACVEALEKAQRVPPYNLGTGVVEAIRTALDAAKKARG